MGGGGWSREENNGFTEEEAYWSFLKNNLPKIWKKKKIQAIETYLQVTHPSWLFKYKFL